jgi:hypothetical protein
MAQAEGISDWRLPLAAMLSQIGCVAVPAEVLRRARTGVELTEPEQEVFLSHAEVGRQLLEHIPRLDDVATWVGEQTVRLRGVERAHAPVTKDSEPPRLVLHAALDYLSAVDVMGQHGAALRQLGQTGHYSASMLDALDLAAAELSPGGTPRELKLADVRPGMLLQADVVTATGMTLVREGERVTEAVAARLANFARTVGVVEPIKVLD